MKNGNVAVEGTAFTLINESATLNISADAIIVAGKNVDISSELKDASKVLSLAGTTYKVVAAKASVEKDDTVTNYESLEKALENAQAGATVTLLDDLTVDTLTIDNAITLDLNSKTLTATVIVNNQLTVTNGTVTAFMLNTPSAILVLNNVQMSVDISEYLKADNKLLKTEGTTYSVIAAKALLGSTPYATLADAVGNANDGDIVTLLDDATIDTLSIGKGITLDLNSKTLTADISIGANVTVKNGTVVANNTAFTLNDGAALTLIDVTVSGGSKIFGGFFNGNVTVSDAMVDAINNAGYTVTDDNIVRTAKVAIGTTNYETLEDAIAHATKYQTIKLLASYIAENPILINKSINLDLNGNSLTYKGADATAFLTIASNQIVTLKNGEINVSAGNLNALIYNSGKLTIVDAELNGNGTSYVVLNDATSSCTIKGTTVITTGNACALKMDGNSVAKIDIGVKINDTDFGASTINKLANKIEAKAYVLNYQGNVYGIYASFEKAHANTARYYTLVLLEDYTGNININQSFGFNLNGKTLKLTDSLQIAGGKAVTLKNGKIEVASTANINVLINNLGGLNLVDITLDGTLLSGDTTYVIYNNGDSGSCYIKEKTVISTKVDGSKAYAFNVSENATVDVFNPADEKMTGAVEINGKKLCAAQIEDVLDKIDAKAYVLGYQGTTIRGFYADVENAIGEAKKYYTVVLMADYSGKGLVITESIGINLNGHTITLTEGADSAVGFRVAADVTFSGGTIKIADNVTLTSLIENNYCLRVVNMILDGRKLSGETSYVINNNGGCYIKGNTSILTKNDGTKAYAFNVSENHFVKVDNDIMFGDGETSNLLNAATVESLKNKIDAEAYTLNYGSKAIFGFYAKVEQAIKEAYKGYTVMLMRAAEMESLVDAKASITLNTNGYSFTCEFDEDEFKNVTVKRPAQTN